MCAIAAFLVNSTAFALLRICPNLAEFVDSGRRDFGKRNSVKKEVLRERVFWSGGLEKRKRGGEVEELGLVGVWRGQGEEEAWEKKKKGSSQK
jgi:hypothetical protein